MLVAKTIKVTLNNGNIEGYKSADVTMSSNSNEISFEYDKTINGELEHMLDVYPMTAVSKIQYIGYVPEIEDIEASVDIEAETELKVVGTI